MADEDDAVTLVDACPMPEPHRTSWLLWLERHCAACGRIMDRSMLIGTTCPGASCMKLINPATSENLLDHLEVAWRHGQGPLYRVIGDAWDHIREFCGEFLPWYEPETSTTGLDELDKVLEKHLQHLLDIGG